MAARKLKIEIDVEDDDFLYPMDNGENVSGTSELDDKLQLAIGFLSEYFIENIVIKQGTIIKIYNFGKAYFEDENE